MAEKLYVFYDKTTPFQGYIRETGKVNLNEAPDGSTVKEHLERLLIRYPGSEIKYFPLGLAPDKESQKVIGKALVPLAVTDITPKAQKALDEALKRQDIADNLPSWSEVEGALDTIKSNAAAATTIAGLKAALAPLLDFEKKHARVTYWLAKNRSD